MSLQLTYDGPIATLELARPERHNAINLEVRDAFEKAATELEARGGAVRVVVIRGAGASFCSGADLSMMKTLDAAGARQFMLQMAWSFRRLEALGAPLLAAARGYCLGGGLELLLHCDLVVVDATVQIGFPEVGIGLSTTAGSVSRLVAAVGAMRARELLYRGRRVGAEEAVRIGLALESVGNGDVHARAAELASELAAQPPEGLSAMKRLVRRHSAGADAESWIAELEAFEGLFRRKQGGQRD